MTEVLLDALEIVGVLVFAMTGALVAVRRRLDVFGVTVLALLTGLGGGVVRDVLVGNVPPSALSRWQPFVAALAAAAVVIVWHDVIGRREQQVLVLDAFGLGMFCTTGAIVASEAGLGVWPAAVMGVITAVGGGIVRDLLASRVPVVLQGDLYATPAALGALIASVVWHLDLPAPLYVVGSATCIVWRLLAMRRGWSAPRPRFRDA